MAEVIARWPWEGESIWGSMEVRVVRLPAGLCATVVADPEYPDDEGVDIARLAGARGCLNYEVLRRLAEGEALRTAARRLREASAGDGEDYAAALEALMAACKEVDGG